MDGLIDCLIDWGAACRTGEKLGISHHTCIWIIWFLQNRSHSNYFDRWPCQYLQFNALQLWMGSCHGPKTRQHLTPDYILGVKLCHRRRIHSTGSVFPRARRAVMMIRCRQLARIIVTWLTLMQCCLRCGFLEGADHQPVVSAGLIWASDPIIALQLWHLLTFKLTFEWVQVS